MVIVGLLKFFYEVILFRVPIHTPACYVDKIVHLDQSYDWDLGQSPYVHQSYDWDLGQSLYVHRRPDLTLTETKGFFQFQIIINVSVSSFRCIWIPMLLVYGHWKYFHSSSARIDFRRQNLQTGRVENVYQNTCDSIYTVLFIIN